MHLDYIDSVQSRKLRFYSNWINFQKQSYNNIRLFTEKSSKPHPTEPQNRRFSQTTPHTHTHKKRYRQTFEKHSGNYPFELESTHRSVVSITLLLIVLLTHRGRGTSITLYTYKRGDLRFVVGLCSGPLLGIIKFEAVMLTRPRLLGRWSHLARELVSGDHLRRLPLGVNVWGPLLVLTGVSRRVDNDDELSYVLGFLRKLFFYQ